MNAEAIAAVSVAVVTVVQFLKWTVSKWTDDVDGKVGPLNVLLCSLAGVAFWAWTQGDFGRTTAFGYFAGWAVIATSAAGVHGFTRATGEAITKMRPKSDE